MARKSTYLLTMTAIDLRRRRAGLIESLCKTEAQLADLDRDLNAADAEIHSRMESVGVSLMADGRHLWMLADEWPRHTYSTTASPHDVDDKLPDEIDAPPAPGPQAPPAVAEAAVDDDGGEEEWKIGEQVAWTNRVGSSGVGTYYGYSLTAHSELGPHRVRLADGSVLRFFSNEIRRPSPCHAPDSDGAHYAAAGLVKGEGVGRG